MTRYWHIAYGLVLTGLAGFVDAIGFIRLGGLYTSLMTGNMTQLAVAVGHNELHLAVLPALLILAFLVGAVMGGALTALTPPRWTTASTLAFEALAVTAAFGAAAMSLEIGTASLFLALAMGAQNAALGQVQGFRAGTTFVTGALFGFGQKLALALAGTGPRFGWVSDGIVWVSLIVGAVAGTVAHAHLAMHSLAIPAGITGFLALAAAVLAATRPPAQAAGGMAAESTAKT